eukprot:GABU01004655.1.p1 GENE.GABU01004655.1~~GABU01004655.1.p1  ORF type:complete len:204 (-),score=2.19 GABU01004655.1:160-771(-)
MSPWRVPDERLGSGLVRAQLPDIEVPQIRLSSPDKTNQQQMQPGEMLLRHSTRSQSRTLQEISRQASSSDLTAASSGRKPLLPTVARIDPQCCQQPFGRNSIKVQKKPRRYQGKQHEAGKPVSHHRDSVTTRLERHTRKIRCLHQQEGVFKQRDDAQSHQIRHQWLPGQQEVKERSSSFTLEIAYCFTIEAKLDAQSRHETKL